VIIRSEPGALLFITQPDHAALAADLVSHFDGVADHPRRDEIQLAVLEHDNGWRELDADLVFDEAAGKALDFISVPESVKRSVWPRGIDALATQSPYAAALVSEHAIFVHEAHRSKPEWRAFFLGIEERRADLLARVGLSREALFHDYLFLALADLMSLAFCNGWQNSQERLGHQVRCEGDAVLIAPALLPAAPVPARVRARRVADQRHDSARALRDALALAPIEFVAGVARGAPPA
jgi:hypothetical protein